LKNNAVETSHRCGSSCSLLLAVAQWCAISFSPVGRLKLCGMKKCADIISCRWLWRWMSWAHLEWWKEEFWRMLLGCTSLGLPSWHIGFPPSSGAISGSSFSGMVVHVFIVSILFAPSTGELFVWYSCLNCLISTFFFLNLVPSLLLLGLVYKFAVHPPSLMGVWAPSDVRCIASATSSSADCLGGMMTEVLLWVYLECTPGAVWITSGLVGDVELCWIGVVSGGRVVCFTLDVLDNAWSALICHPGWFLACSWNFSLFALPLLLFFLFHW